jgi:membrane protein DedA with SNARE-associated domain
MTAPDFIGVLLASGIAGVAMIALAEKLIPIVPSYVLLVFLGMTIVAGPRGLTLTIVATTLGSTVGSLCWYGLGRAVGAHRIEALVSNFGRYVFLSPSLYQRMTRAYLRNQIWVTLLGQVVPTARIYLSLPAGVLRIALPGFLVATLAGSLIWNACLLTLGYAVRDSGLDPVSVGVMVITGLVVSELGLALGLWVLSRSSQR